MEWTDEGVLLAVRHHGESSAIIQLFTRHHGRSAGLVRGGAGRRLRPLLQVGTKLRATWRARLAEHLGTFTVEGETSYAAAVLQDPAALEALNAACALAVQVLPEREPHEPVYEGLEMLLQALTQPDIWPALFVRWELGVLQELGFGLSLGRCAVTGAQRDLTHVSPRTGCAVCRQEAAPYLDRLLPLPDFLREQRLGPVSADDVRDGFRLTGHFLERWVLAPHGQSLPAARARMVTRLFR